MCLRLFCFFFFLLFFFQELWNIRENLTVSLAGLVRTNNPLYGTFPIPLATTTSTPAVPETDSANSAGKVCFAFFLEYFLFERTLHLQSHSESFIVFQIPFFLYILFKNNYQ